MMLSGHLPGWMCCSRAAVVVVAVGVIQKIKIDILAKVLQCLAFEVFSLNMPLA